MPSITVTGTKLEYTVDDLSPDVTYIVECVSANGVDSCDSSMDTIISKLIFPYIHLNYQ